MRLLNIESLQLAEFRDDKRPKYVIASHRWVEGCEATFQDVQNRHDIYKSGYKKIVDFARYIQEHIPLVEWLWIDTCCINKDSAAELSEAINLMFSWYCDAELCVAYLEDVETADDKGHFAQSEWFRRGWTLQELLAPSLVVFVTKTWRVIGNKGASTRGSRRIRIGPSLEGDIARITGIPEQVLHDYRTSRNLSVEEKLRWMEGRNTTREEDMSYALYGIFDVTPGVNYGERREGARQRLLAAIHFHDNLTAQQADRFQQIVAWLSASNPWTNHQSARQLHEPRTGVWLAQSDQYRSWKAALVRHLWMYGKAGCGKTILCSTAIEDVKAYCERHPDAGYAAFYFSFSDKQKQRLVDLLRSLVVQLGWKGPALSMLRQVYDRPNRSLLGLDELEYILLACFESYSEVFLLVDALDECPEEGDVRHNITECLARLSQKAHHVRILVTSRELPDIRASMATLEAEQIAIATHVVDEDIRQHVATQLSRNYRLCRLERATKVLIEETISAKADGMFRWAHCQLQELKKLKSTRPKFVKNALFALPATLDETYERMLLGIPGALRPDALTLLRWLAYAKSPPSLGELVDATIIDFATDGDVEVEDRPGVDDTLEILSGLVTTLNAAGNDNEPYEMQDAEDNEEWIASRHQQVDKDTKVRLAHFSVKEYLESRRILESGAKEFHFEPEREHRYLTQSCLVYLTHYSSSDERTSKEQDYTSFPLLRYAAESWFYHAALQQSEEVTHETSFLCDKDALRNWLLAHGPDQSGGRPFEGLRSIGSGLYYASFIGLEAVVRKLLRDGADVNAQGGVYGNALQGASYRGNEEIVQVLMNAGANIDAQGGHLGNALQAASYKGYSKVVHMLLDAGADINAEGGLYGHALQAAAVGGRKEVVQMLLDAGADISAQGGTFGNALESASVGRNENIFQMLIAAGANVHYQEYFSNALHAASHGGHVKVVQMLLDMGADVNAQGGRYGDALQAASVRGHAKVVQMLLNVGADVNAQGGVYGNALQGASHGGNEEIVQVLMNAGANVNAQGGSYGNALQAASSEGHEKTVQTLLDVGADVNAQGGMYENALQAASLGFNGLMLSAELDIRAEEVGLDEELQADLNRYEKVVQMLLIAGADVNTRGGSYGNALQAASVGGDEKIVQMLLDTGAGINVQGGDYYNALQAASAEGHKKVVQVLIGTGADVNAQGGPYGNALQAASVGGYEILIEAGVDVNAGRHKEKLYGGYEKIVQILIDAGADVNVQGGKYSNALQAASWRGNKKAVQTLVGAGAEVNAQGGEYGNALQAASVGGHVKVVQMLLNMGAEVNAQGGEYGNALQAASVGGHAKVVQMLVDAGAHAVTDRGVGVE